MLSLGNGHNSQPSRCLGEPLRSVACRDIQIKTMMAISSRSSSSNMRCKCVASNDVCIRDQLGVHTCSGIDIGDSAGSSL